MVVTVKQSTSKNLKTKEALFVSFPYNMDLVGKVKSLKTRYYIPESREWEIPLKDINDVISLFSDYEIKIDGKIKKDVVEKIEKMVHFDSNNVTKNYISKTKPFTHQIEGILYGLEHSKFLLADEQGLGKTKQAIDLAVIRKPQFKHCLVICCVNGLKWNWFSEIGIHSNEKGHILGSRINKKGNTVIGSNEDRYVDLCNGTEDYFIITNIESLQNKKIAEQLNKMCMDGTIGMTIVDEIHKGVVNPTSIQGKALHQLTSYYKMALTGTPILNSPLDSYNILRWLDIEKHAFYSFKSRYTISGGYGGYQTIGYKNLSELETIISGHMLRRKKVDVLDLPPKIYSNEYVEMSVLQKSIYNEVKEQILDNIDQVKTATNPLSMLIRLRQATASTEILSSKFTNSAKIERLKELLDENIASGQKTVVFTNWTTVTEILERELKSYNPLFITGKTPDNQRQDNVNKFQNDPECMLICGTIGAAGTGITLTAANNVIFLDEPWNWGVFSQCADRCHRIGTTNTVSVKVIMCKDTIDERVHDIILEKKAIADGLIDGDWHGRTKTGLVDFLLK